MRKLLVASVMFTALAAFSAPSAEAVSKSAQARAEKRAKCTAEAKQFTDRGRGFRTRYRACMVRW